MENLNKIDSKVLANIIVAYRCLNSNRDLAIASMQELSKRRDNGDSFQYEEFIDLQSKKIKSIFDLNSNKGNDLKNMLNMVLSIVKV